MVRQTKRFKKGLNKKVLSAILAASMIMTSSSFAFASTTDEAAAENTAVSQDVNGVLTEDGDAEDLGDDADAADVTEPTEEAVPATLGLTPDAAPSVQTDTQASEKPNADSLEVYVAGSETELQKYELTYNGEYQDPKLVVKDGSTVIPDTQYTVHYYYNKNAGGYEGDPDSSDNPYVEIKFNSGDYSGQSKKVNFVINQASIENAEVKWETIRSFEYDGKAHYPKVREATISLIGKTYMLTSDDYEVTNYEGEPITDDGEYAINVHRTDGQDHYVAYITGKGNFKGTISKTEASDEYVINQADLGEAVKKGNVSVTVDQVAYNNELDYNTVKSSVHIIENATDNPFGEFDYAIKVKDENGEWVGESNKELPDSVMSIGTHALKIYIPNADGNYEKDSYIETTYEVVASSLSTMVKGVAVKDFKDGKSEYTGENQFPDDLKTVLGNKGEIKGLKYGSDYVITNDKEEWINAGEYTLNLEGRNEYAGQTATVTVKITPRALNLADIKVEQGTHRSGDLGSVIVTIKDEISTKDGEDEENVVLEEGKDYTFEVTKESSSVSAGKVAITGIGNYTTEDEENGVITDDIDFYKNQLPLNDPSISVEYVGDYTLDDNDEILVKLDDFKLVEKDGSATYELKPVTDYSFYQTTNVQNEAGEVSVELQGNGDYTGTRVVKFNINGVSFADTFEIKSIDDIYLDDLEQGKKVTVNNIIQNVKVVYKDGNGQYDNKDLVIEVYNADGEKLPGDTDLAKAPGTYTVKVSPEDEKYYTGSLETTFNVIGHDLKKAGAVVSDIEDQVYTSEAITPAVTVKVGDKTLVAGEDYEVTYTDNVKGGEATAIITGINNYSGTLEKNFNITRAAQAITMTNPLQERDLGNGSRTSTSKVCTLKLATTMADEDTKYTYTTSDPSVATVNAGKITYQGVGECTITVSAAATDSCEAASLDIKVVVGKPGTPTFTPSVTKNTGKKAFVVTSSTVKGVDGWEVQYSIRDDFWKATTKDFPGTKTKLLRQTCKTVHSNMTYYIRVRGYQTVDGEKVYSDWSPVKTIVTK